MAKTLKNEGVVDVEEFFEVIQRAATEKGDIFETEPRRNSLIHPPAICLLFNAGLPYPQKKKFFILDYVPLTQKGVSDCLKSLFGFRNDWPESLKLWYREKILIPAFQNAACEMIAICAGQKEFISGAKILADCASVEQIFDLECVKPNKKLLPHFTAMNKSRILAAAQIYFKHHQENWPITDKEMAKCAHARLVDEMTATLLGCGLVA